MSTELGGGGIVTRQARGGAAWLRNCLRHLGVLRGAGDARGARVAAGHHRVGAGGGELRPGSLSGICEPTVEPGDRVREVTSWPACTGRRSRTGPEPIASAVTGVVCGVRPLAVTRQGDCLVVIGQEVTAGSLVD